VLARKFFEAFELLFIIILTFGVMLGGWVGPTFAGTKEIHIGVAFFSAMSVGAFLGGAVAWRFRVGLCGRVFLFARWRFLPGAPFDPC